MQLPTINHPTDRPNFTEVDIGGLTLWFSYRTVIAYRVAWSEPVVRENDWGATTGRHLNHIDGGDKSGRLAGSVFERQLGLTLAALEATV